MEREIEEINDQWTIIYPVQNLWLTDLVKNEVRVDRVTFTTKEKLIRKKGIFGKHSVSSLKKGPLTQGILDRYRAFAIVRCSGKLDAIRPKAFGLIKEELLILASSQLGFGKRSRNASPGIYGYANPGKRESISIGVKTGVRQSGSSIKKVMSDLKTDYYWKKHAKTGFFFGALKIIRGDIKVSPKWKNLLRRTLVLIGEGQCTENRHQAFLWNMIAMEMLVSVEGDKYTESIPERLEALLGWTQVWVRDSYKAKIKELYVKRCNYVHEGDYNAISARDVVFSDELLLNLLGNIVRHPKIFGSKNSLIEFSEKIKAERTLNIKPKVRPKTLKYVLGIYSEADYKEMETPE